MLWDETEMSVPKASKGNNFQVDAVCMTCDKCYTKSNVTEEIEKVVMLPWWGPTVTFMGFTLWKPPSGWFGSEPSLWPKGKARA